MITWWNQQARASSFYQRAADLCKVFLFYMRSSQKSRDNHCIQHWRICSISISQNFFEGRKWYSQLFSRNSYNTEGCFYNAARSFHSFSSFVVFRFLRSPSRFIVTIIWAWDKITIQIGEIRGGRVVICFSWFWLRSQEVCGSLESVSFFLVGYNLLSHTLMHAGTSLSLGQLGFSPSLQVVIWNLFTWDITLFACQLDARNISRNFISLIAYVVCMSSSNTVLLWSPWTVRLQPMLERTDCIHFHIFN